MSAIWNGPKNGSRKPNVLRTMVSRSSRVDLALLDDRERLAQQRHLQAVGDEAGAVGDLGGLLAERRVRNASTRSTTARSVAGPAITSMPGVHSGGLNQCTPRKRSGRSTDSASPAIGSEEVLVAMTASGAPRPTRGRGSPPSGPGPRGPPRSRGPRPRRPSRDRPPHAPPRSRAASSSSPASTWPRVRVQQRVARRARRAPPTRRPARTSSPARARCAGDPAAHRAAAEHGDGFDPLHAVLVPLSSGSHPSR